MPCEVEWRSGQTRAQRFRCLDRRRFWQNVDVLFAAISTLGLFRAYDFAIPQIISLSIRRQPPACDARGSLTRSRSSSCFALPSGQQGADTVSDWSYPGGLKTLPRQAAEDSGKNPGP